MASIDESSSLRDLKPTGDAPSALSRGCAAPANGFVVFEVSSGDDATADLPSINAPSSSSSTAAAASNGGDADEKKKSKKKSESGDAAASDDDDDGNSEAKDGDKKKKRRRKKDADAKESSSKADEPVKALVRSRVAPVVISTHSLSLQPAFQPPPPADALPLTAFWFDIASAAWRKQRCYWPRSSDGRTNGALLDGAAVASVGGQFVVVGHLGVAVLKADTNVWLPLAGDALPKPRTHSALVTIKDSAFLFGGLDAAGAPLNDLWRYAPSSDDAGGSWQCLNAGGAASVTMPSARRGAALTAVDVNTLYLFGGAPTEGGTVSELWTFDVKLKAWSLVSRPALSMLLLHL